MKSLVTPQQVTKFPWDVVPPRIIHADQDLTMTDQLTHIEAIIDAIHEPILILDKDLAIKSANKAFYQKFKGNKKKAIGIKLSELSENSPQISKLIKQLKKLSRSNASFEE